MCADSIGSAGVRAAAGGGADGSSSPRDRCSSSGAAPACPPQVGQEVFESDSLRTGGDGRLGVTLKDDTRVSLGPGSEVRLNSFLFTPAEGRLGLVLNFVRGMAVYVSGKIAKLAPDSIRLETPGAIVGVRGTTVALQVVQ